MSSHKQAAACFNCKRTDEEIPVLAWSYQGRPLPVCAACVPTLIHNWHQVAATLADRPRGEA